MEHNHNELREIQMIKQELESDRSLRIKAETKLESLNKQKDEIVEEIKEYGINDPKTLDAEIAKLREEATRMLAEIKAEKPDLTGVQL